MTLPVLLTPRALADIAAIRDFLLARNPSAADSVRDAINRSLALLGAHPHAGRERPELGVRAFGVSRYALTLYYRVDPAAIVIVHVRDDRRRPLSTGEL